MPETKIVQIGIDFGTTYCFAGVLHGDRVMPLVPSNETYGIASVFYYDGKQEFVGKSAESRAKKHPEYAVRSIKRMLKGKPGAMPARFTLADREFTPKEIIIKIVEYVVRGAEKMLEEQYFIEYDKMEAVITVPIAFDPRRRQLIWQAASEITLKSGKPFRVIGMFPEPVSAAIEYLGLSQKDNTNVLVYDLGGGTFDVTLMKADRSGETPYTEIANGGDDELGGDDWDKRLADWITNYCKEEVEVTAATEKEILYRAREYKEELTEIEEVPFEISVKGDVCEGTIQRTEFEKMTADLLERTMNIVREVVGQQKDTKIDYVILTGGSSYMPQVMKGLQALKESGLFEKETEIKFCEPEHAIAYGAARYADTLQWDAAKEETVKSESMVSMIATRSYGVEYAVKAMNGRNMIRIFIKKGEKLPASGMVTSIAKEGTSLYSIYEVDSSEDELLVEVERGTKIMEVHLERPRAIAQGTKAIQTLTLGEDGRLQIHVKDEVSGNVVEDEIKIQTVM